MNLIPDRDPFLITTKDFISNTENLILIKVLTTMDSLPDCGEDEKDDVFTSSNFVQSRILCSTFYAYPSHLYQYSYICWDNNDCCCFDSLEF